MTPTSPYGAGAVKRIAWDAASSHEPRSVVLCYSPLVRVSMVFGDDNLTSNGACVCDQVHVDVLAHAHMQAMGFMQYQLGSRVFNLGGRRGFPLHEVICVVECATGGLSTATWRRAGAWSNCTGGQQRLCSSRAWHQTEMRCPRNIVRSAWSWHSTPTY